MSDVKTDGDCFRTAGTLVLDLHATGVRDARLVHGLVTHPVRKFQHIHAWVEVEDFVFDYTYKFGFSLPKAVYYAAGKIKAEDTVRYTEYHARTEMGKHEHWGPWDEGLIFKESIPEEFATDCKRYPVA